MLEEDEEVQVLFVPFAINGSNLTNQKS